MTQFTYRQYSASGGLPTVAARPSAVLSVAEPVEGGSDILAVTLRANEGLVYENVYFGTNDPGAGDVMTGDGGDHAAGFVGGGDALDGLVDPVPEGGAIFFL